MVVTSIFVELGVVWCGRVCILNACEVVFSKMGSGVVMLEFPVARTGVVQGSRVP